MTRSLLFALTLVHLPIFGCDLVENDDPTVEIKPGAIVFFGDTTEVVLSSNVVRLGNPLSVSVSTFGNGCVSAAGVEVTVDALQATIVPLDSLVIPPPPNGACPDILNVLPHTATMAFSQPGTATIRIRGAIHDFNFPNADGEVELIRRIEVQ